MAGYNGTLEDSHSAVSVKLSWSSTADGEMDFYLEVATDGYGTRSSCWYWVAVNGSRIVDRSISITGDGYHYAWSTSGYSAPVGSSGILNSLEAGFGYDSETYGKKEAVATRSNIQVADANYTVYYYYQNGSNESTYVDGHNTNETHTIISTIPTYDGDYDTTTTFKITGYANGGDGGDKSITASKRTWSTHTFLGWSTSSSATSASYKAGNTFKVKKDTYLYGVWKASSGTTYSNNTLADLGSTTWSQSGTGYTVSLNVNGGNTISPSTLASGITTTHEFLGWNTSSTATSALSNTTAYTSTATVYAIWKTTVEDNSTVTLPTPTKSDTTAYHTINLNGNGGTTSTTSIQTPIVTSYSFKGWSTSSSSSSGVTGTYTPTDNVTLYAIWSTNSPTYPDVTLPTSGLSKSSSTTSYKTTLNLNGGNHNKTSVITGTTTSYSFSHWSNTKSGTSIGTTVSGTTYSTLYAIWSSSITSNTANLGTPTKSVSYRVTFDPSGGSVSPTYKNVSGSYTFKGWYTTNSSSGTKVSNTSSYRATSNNTLYAIWSSSPNLTGISLPTPTRSAVDGTFTVTLNGNGGSISSSIVNPITVSSKTSFTFGGWATVSGDDSTIISNTSSYTTTSACTLYAIWNPDTDIAGIVLPTSGITRSNSVVSTYKITLDPVDGSVNPTYINTNKIRKYAFAGWSPTGNTSNMVSSNNYVPVSDITLKAAYNTSDSIQPVDLPNATKTDHTFLGWTKVEGDTNYIPSRYTTNGNITLYANYLANYRASLWIWYNGKWNKVVLTLFSGDRFNSAI